MNQGPTGSTSNDQDKRLDTVFQRYTNMHEISRHIIHSTEILRAGLHTLESITKDFESFCKEEDFELLVKDLRSQKQMAKSLSFSTTTLQNLQFRSDAFYQRLRNEIELVSQILHLKVYTK